MIVVDRRNAIKSIGSVLIGCSAVGSSQAASGSRSSLKAYENYCQKLSEKFGPKKDGKVAAQKANGKDINPSNISTSIENSEVKKGVKSKVKSAGKPTDTLYTKEILEFADGTEVEQYVYTTDQNQVVVSVNEKEFIIDRSELITTLQQRFQQIEKDPADNKNVTVANQINETSPKTTSGKVSSASSYTHDDLANYEVGSLSTPITGSAAVDPNWTNDTTDRVELGASSLTVGYSNAQIAAWDTWDLSGGSNEIKVEFNGSFSAATVNALGLSKVQLECFIAYDGDNKVRTTNGVYENNFVADGWSDNGEWDATIWEPDYDYDQVLVGIHGYVKAGGVQYSASVADAHTNDDFLSYDGYFNLDNYTLEIE